jgi:hypothetical protein
MNVCDFFTFGFYKLASQGRQKHIVSITDCNKVTMRLQTAKGTALPKVPLSHCIECPQQTCKHPHLSQRMLRLREVERLV